MIYGDTILKVLVDRGDIRNTYEGAINPASINIHPVPQKGSNNNSPSLIRERLTIQRASFGFIDPG